MDKHRVQRARRPASLADALTALSPVSGRFLEVLSDRRDIGSARQTCKALRAFIDDNLTRIRLVVRPEHAVLFPSDEEPSLLRWPNCRSVDLRIELPVAHVPVALLAGLPFAYLPHAQRLRITTLALSVVDIEGGASCSELAVPQLAAVLPNLQKLDLHDLGGMSTRPLEQQLMFQSLATMPHLEDLTLPSVFIADSLACLAGSKIRRLTIGPPQRGGIAGLTDLAYEAISRMQSLEQLAFQHHMPVDFVVGGYPSIDFARLLRSLPPSLRHFWTMLSDPGAVGYIGLSITLREGRAAEINACEITTWDREPDTVLTVPVFARIARQLLASRMLPPGHQLELLSLDYLAVPAGSRLEEEDLQDLRDLLGRCQEVWVEDLYADPGAAMQALDLLGCVPTHLGLRAGGGRVWLQLRAEQGTGVGQGQAWWEQAQQQQEAETEVEALRAQTVASAGGGFPSVDHIAQRVLRLMTTRPVNTSSSTQQEFADKRIRLLRGTQVAQVLQQDGGPALDAWLRALSKQTGAEDRSQTQLAAATGDSVMSRSLLATYQCLPGCMGAGVLVAFLDDAALAAASGQPEETLEVLPVAIRDRNYEEDGYLPLEARCYHAAAEQVLQELLDARRTVGSTGGSQEVSVSGGGASRGGSGSTSSGGGGGASGFDGSSSDVAARVNGGGVSGGGGDASGSGVACSFSAPSSSGGVSSGDGDVLSPRNRVWLQQLLAAAGELCNLPKPVSVYP